MKVLDAEKTIGIETFFTQTKGVGGKLRAQTKDFFVNEISNYPPEKFGGKFTIADVTSNYWETNLLVRALSNRLHISRQRIGFAGTKDKRAITKQLMSFYKVDIERLPQVKIKDVEIENIYQSDRPIKMGTHLGNKFEIIVKNLNSASLKNIDEIYSTLKRLGGFPNFYGIQRFGIIRPITHIVGKYIVQGDVEKAVMTYVANPIKGEDEETYQLRKDLQETYDFAKALKNYPNQLSFEKAILNKIVVDEKDYVGALKELPKNLLTMFVYAYQSYLFNKILSKRIKEKITLNEANVGDIVLPIRKDVIDQTGIIVKKINIEKVNKQISKGKAAISGVLFGSDSVFSEGRMGEIEHKIIEQEKIDPRDFIIPDIPFISSSGSRRPLLGFVKNLNYSLIDDELSKGKKALKLNFELPKGSYATSLLREFMKAKDIKNY